jgi:hypothetical protein
MLKGTQRLSKATVSVCSRSFSCLGVTYILVSWGSDSTAHPSYTSATGTFCPASAFETTRQRRTGGTSMATGRRVHRGHHARVSALGQSGDKPSTWSQWRTIPSTTYPTSDQSTSSPATSPHELLRRAPPPPIGLLCSISARAAPPTHRLLPPIRPLPPLPPSNHFYISEKLARVPPPSTAAPKPETLTRLGVPPPALPMASATTMDTDPPLASTRTWMSSQTALS